MCLGEELMAACKLIIELEDPKRVRIGGEPISGMVVVKADKDVRCKGLQVTTCWETHGRGNLARGDVELVTLFEGDWQESKEYRYPFKLPSAVWPPTYYGNYLNVSHYVQATANVPWSIDPTTREEFVVTARETPPDLAPTSNTVKKSGWIGWLIGIILVGLLLTPALVLVLILVPIIAIVGGGVWFFRSFLPSQITGPIQYTVGPAMVSAGQTLSGSCEFTPRWSTQINGIRWTVRCEEKCVSGSGSNRSTHTHEVLSKVIPLSETCQLQSGQTQKFSFSFRIPNGTPPSMKFSDNEVNWSSEFRIDIPKWPDWVKNVPFIAAVASNTTVGESPNLSAPSDPPISETMMTPAEDTDPWLTEVLQQIVQSAEDDDRLEAVLEAVKEQSFTITVNTQSEVDEHVESDFDQDDGAWVSAVDPLRNARLVLYIPSSMNPEAMMWMSNLTANALVLGLETETGRVMMRLVRTEM